MTILEVRSISVYGLSWCKMY